MWELRSQQMEDAKLSDNQRNEPRAEGVSAEDICITYVDIRCIAVDAIQKT